MKTCPHCKATKELSEFGKDKRTNTGISCYCRECLREKARRQRERDPLFSRRCHLKRRYNLSLSDFTDMVKSQNGLCAICGTEPDELVVDHCHTNGNVRGLLCHSCNTGLGKFFDNTAYLTNALNYLSNV
jgi:hypothetical protein